MELCEFNQGQPCLQSEFQKSGYREKPFLEKLKKRKKKEGKKKKRKEGRKGRKGKECPLVVWH